MRYIVSAAPYDETNGGAIFQHLLVDALNRLGETAHLWPQPPIYPKSRRERLFSLFRRYATRPDLDTPVFRGKYAPADTIVVYPEVVLGNPLEANHVVRWLLYRPGVLHPYEFTDNEMFFHCGEFFDVPEITGGAPELSMWYRNRTYENQDRPDRKGVAYIIRKGDKKPRLPETETPDAVCVDGMTHAEVNDVLNRVQTFISYDEATTYSQFAAICGCDSIVVPGFYDSHEAWTAEHPLGRYGISYGFDHLDHARATRHKVIELMDEKERESLESVKRFIRLTKERFAGLSAAA